MATSICCMCLSVRSLDRVRDVDDPLVQWSPDLTVRLMMSAPMVREYRSPWLILGSRGIPLRIAVQVLSRPPDTWASPMGNDPEQRNTKPTCSGLCLVLTSKNRLLEEFPARGLATGATPGTVPFADSPSL